MNALRLMTICALLVCSQSRAEVVTVIGIAKQALEHQPFERAASIGYRLNLSSSWFVKPELGGWIGGRGKASWFVGAPVGLQVWIPMTGVYASAAIGPARISQPDEVLGGRGQFLVEFGFGLKTERASIGVSYVHISSAGLVLPNLGRDFFPAVTVGFAL